MAGSGFGVLLVGVLLGTAWLSSCIAYDFYVGDGHGWFPDPYEQFNHWSARNRFQVKDKIVFNYDKETDSVMLVSKDHYDTCNTTDPYLMLEGGESTYTFSRSGPFYFISGNSTRCKDHGEKLVVVVMAIRPPMQPRPIFPPPAPAPTPSPAPGHADESPSMAPENAGDHSPSISPSQNEKSSNVPPQHSSSQLIDFDLISGFLVGLLALVLGGAL